MTAIHIFDTTLRDGEQTPGVRLSPLQKLKIAKLLELLGVDIIEAGFAAASPVEVSTLQTISREVRRPVICALARARHDDIDAAARALQFAARPRIHTFIASSEVHMRHKLRMSADAVLEQAVRSVEYARQFCDEVQFSAEDASRSDPAFLTTLCREVARAGASIINLPDTVGYALPEETRALFTRMTTTPDIDASVRWSAHCHDDLGLASANSLAAISGGARQVEGCLLGVGERAGNAALEEIVMALVARQGEFHLSTQVNTQAFGPVCQEVATLLGVSIGRSKAIIGANAFAHESGIHQDGVLKNASTYEVISPASVGWQHQRLSLGKLSGRAALQHSLQALGVTLPEAELAAAFVRFKALAAQGHVITEALLRERVLAPQQ